MTDVPATVNSDGRYYWYGTFSNVTGGQINFVGDLALLTGKMGLTWTILQRSGDGSYPVVTYSKDGGTTLVSAQVGSEGTPQETVNESGEIVVDLTGATALSVNVTTSGGSSVPGAKQWVLAIAITRNVNETLPWDSPSAFDPLAYNAAFADKPGYLTDTLGNLRARIMRRIGFSVQALTPPPGMTELVNDFLISSQSFLYRRYLALHMRRFFRWKIIPGQRFYSLQDNDDSILGAFHMDPTKPVEWAGVQDTRNVWYPLIKGIPPTLYTMLTKTWRPARYDIGAAVEIYPAPDQTYWLWLKGMTGLGAFAADGDFTSIDSELVFMHALALAKAHYGQPDANNYESMANTYRGELIAGTHQTAHYVPGTLPIPPAVQPTMIQFVGELMRPYPLTALKGGINRLRTKGGARADQLYDILNGYVDQAGGISPREGTARAATLTSGTVGLCASDGIFHVFAKSIVSVPAGYECNALVHPTNAALDPVKIWFAKPFMGFLFVVAEFSNGDIFHYWLQSSGTWAANTVYKNSDIVLPTVLNGLAYQAVRNSAANPTWSTQTAVVLNQIVEPTVYTGYAYKATGVAGTSPHTGSVEPSWPMVTGGTVQEFGDFSTSSTVSGDTTTTTSDQLSTSITDRYGNSSTVAGQTGTASSISTSVAASTDVTVWAPGTLYPPGSVVKPSTGQGAFINAIPNGDFENGSDGNWTLAGSGGFVTSNQYQGVYAYQLTAANSVSTVTMTNYGVVTAGQSVTASAYVNPNNPGNGGADLTMNILLKFYDSSNTLLSTTPGPNERNPGYRKTSVTAVAPVGAARVRVAVQAGNGTSSKTGFLDLVVWDLEQPAAVSNFIYEAVQASTLSSGTSEPVWPTVAGNTVTDNGVVWKAIGTSIITWTAQPIMQSGGSEPTWPLVIGQAVNDGTMSWRAINRQIADTNDPNTKAVALAASHVFAGDNDICSYSAAVDPTDWTSSNNAGYLPTGLNNYGDNPVAMLALYRSNLMVFNAGGYQMWQVDPDPANMALLDAQPIGSVWPRAAQSVSNNLLLLTEVGVRDIGTVGATANMQIGGLGQPVDPIVVAQMKLGTYDPFSLYYPGRGQYWLIFGPQAFVLTMSGNSQKAWSRYVFPAAITDAALNGGDLYLRTATNLVWKVDSTARVDDFGGANVNFNGVLQWPYLDCGPLGLNKMLQGVDIVGDGAVTVQIGFNEREASSFSDNPGFATSPYVTTPYSIALADTQPGQPLPFGLSAQSFSLILTFGPNQAWSWQASNFYLIDSGGGGATG